MPTDCGPEPFHATEKANQWEDHTEEAMTMLENESTSRSEDVAGSCSETAADELSNNGVDEEPESGSNKVPLEGVTELNQRLSTPDTGDTPHQPVHFNFLKCKFGETRIRKHSFHADWFTSFPWVHYDEQGDHAFCF